MRRAHLSKTTNDINALDLLSNKVVSIQDRDAFMFATLLIFMNYAY